MFEKRKILTSILCMLMAVLAWAIPVERIRFMATLTDGTQLMVTSFGDEHLSFFLTDDGMVVELTDSGFVLTDYSRDAYISLHESSGMRRVKRQVGTIEYALLPQTGHPHVAVLLVQFKDKFFTVAPDSASVHDYYDKYCNGSPGSSPYTGHGSSGAIVEYFSDQSNGQFLPVFDVIGPLTLDREYAYYGQDSGSSTDVNYNTFVKESMRKANKTNVDWSQMDNNGDGKVDMAFILFAGLGQNYTNQYGDPNTIWPNERSAQYQVDGVTFAGCCSTCELRPTAASDDGVITATKPDGIGVFCHELSHALGLPDFYDYNYKAFGMDYWSLMDYGQYARSGRTPVNYTAYERDFVRWQALEELKEPCTIRIPCFAKGGHGYKIVNKANPNEFYVLENRQAYGWDIFCETKGHGLMVTHVDYDRSAWTGNRLNSNVSHQRMTIIPANNTLIGANNFKSTAEWTASLNGNLYPGTSDNHELTNESTPASVVFLGQYMSKPIYDIEETEDKIIVLKFNPLGTLEVPMELTPVDVTDTEATLMWDAVEGAEFYNIRVTDVFDEVVLQADSISALSYQMEDLEPETIYNFTVQAIADKYRNSEWSAPASFSTSLDPDGFSHNIYEDTQLVRVYDTNGIMVTECKANQLSRLRVRSGIYIIRYGNGKTHKTLISA
ncbi:MAG: M6 family metalloprotease domain-containing protein [Bacteroidaceae bacterium]|nr:M6 family metalloprotease domain-containing protein [Bacteroidaceae bacterium]